MDGVREVQDSFYARLRAAKRNSFAQCTHFECFQHVSKQRVCYPPKAPGFWP